MKAVVFYQAVNLKMEFFLERPNRETFQKPDYLSGRVRK